MPDFYRPGIFLAEISYLNILIQPKRPFEGLSRMTQNNYSTLKPIFLILLSSVAILNAQTPEFKIIKVSDSSQITPELIQFDSIWYHCMKGYGTKDLSRYFEYPVRSYTNPIIALNLLNGVEGYYHLLNYELQSPIDIKNHLRLYKLNLGWMQLAIVYNTVTNKIGQTFDFNWFETTKIEYRNLCVFSGTNFINAPEIKKSLDLTMAACKEIGVDTNYFLSKNIHIFQEPTIIAAERLIGTLFPTKYFSENSTYGGMADPYTQTIISGVGNKIHTHELIHLANPLNDSLFRFISEGIATYYGGTGIANYTDHLPEVIELLKTQNITSFNSLFQKPLEGKFNVLRGNYILAAYLLNYVKSQFGIQIYQHFIQSCTNQETMLRELMRLHHHDEDSIIFAKIYLNKK